MQTRDRFYRISIKALVYEDETRERFLLSKEDDGTWELLGGGLDHGEDHETCLRREIKEETGLEVVEIADKPSYFVTVQHSVRKTWMANIIYETELKDLNFTASNECVELRYFSPEEALNEKIFANVRKLAELLRS